MMGFNFDFVSIAQVFFAFVLGAIIGFEREWNHSPAGIRTYAAVCLGACVFSIASTHPHGYNVAHGEFDPTRIAAQVASGIGFLGAGVIFKEGLNTVGLTTAATLWATAAVGVVIAFHMYAVAALTTFFILLLLMLPTIPGLKLLTMKKRKLDNYRKPN